VYSPDAAELGAAREQLVTFSARLLDDGLAVGSAGNLSLRCGDLIAITPSGISYDEPRTLSEAELAEVAAEARRRGYGTRRTAQPGGMQAEERP
jgi:ribulose-5-phosphate 4-epimerase/fuculose-1-phosphate aldolase